MDLDKIILASINKDELKTWIQSTIKEEFNKRETLTKEPENNDLLTRNEVAKIYKTSLVTLRQWEKKGIIPKPIRKRTRVLFRKSDILNIIKRKENI